MKKSLTDTLLKLSKSTNTNTLELATIDSISPFKIKIGSLLVTKENLLISEHLIDFKRKINFNSNVNGQIVVGTQTGILKSLQIDNKELELNSMLNIGDLLVVQEIENGQRYIILNKVVEL